MYQCIISAVDLARYSCHTFVHKHDKPCNALVHKVDKQSIMSGKEGHDIPHKEQDGSRVHSYSADTMNQPQTRLFFAGSVYSYRSQRIAQRPM